MLHGQKLGIPPVIMPFEMEVRLVYGTGHAQSSISGAVTRVFSCNSAFDPDVTGVGGQPVGFDEMSAIYDSYYVRASKIEITCRADNETVTEVLMQCVIPTYTSTVPTVISNSVGNRWFKYCAVPTSSGGFTNVLVNTITTDEFWGRKTRNDIDFTAATTASPSFQFYWNHIVDDVSSSGVNLGCYSFYVITYDIIFFEPKMLARS